MGDYINLLFSCCKDMYLFLIRKINAKIFRTTLFLALHITLNVWAWRYFRLPIHNVRGWLSFLYFLNQKTICNKKTL